MIAGTKLLGQELSLWKSSASPHDPRWLAPAIASAFQAEMRERKERAKQPWSLKDGRLGNGFSFLKSETQP